MVSAGFSPEAPCLPGRNHPEFRRHRLRGGRDGRPRAPPHRAEADGCHPGSITGGESGVVEVDQRGTEPDGIRVAGWIRCVFGERLRGADHRNVESGGCTPGYFRGVPAGTQEAGSSAAGGVSSAASSGGRGCGESSMMTSCWIFSTWSRGMLGSLMMKTSPVLRCS